MIITDPTPESPLKPNAGQGSQPTYAPYPEHPPTQYYHVEHRQSPGRRFFEAFCVAVMVYALAGMFMSSIVWTSHGGHVSRRVINHYTNSCMVRSDCLAGWLAYAIRWAS